MSVPTIKGSLFRQYVQQCFSIAANAFAADPNADNWTDLKVAMWAWQHVQHMSNDVLNDAAHEYLMGVATRSKGDSNFLEGDG